MDVRDTEHNTLTRNMSTKWRMVDAEVSEMDARRCEALQTAVQTDMAPSSEEGALRGVRRRNGRIQTTYEEKDPLTEWPVGRKGRPGQTLWQCR